MIPRLLAPVLVSADGTAGALFLFLWTLWKLKV